MTLRPSSPRSPHARDILGKMLDLHEARPDRSRPVSRPVPVEAMPHEDRAAMTRDLEAAEGAGAVALKKGRRELAHLYVRVTLADADALYGFLGRTPAPSVADATVARALSRLDRPAPETLEAAERLRSAFARGQAAFGIGADNGGRAADFLAAVEALIQDPPDGRDMRTYSRRTTGDSKTFERASGPLAQWLRQRLDLPADLTQDRVLAAAGVEKFPQPVLISGPVALDGRPLGVRPYVGLPPEAVERIELSAPVRSILMIENLASFNRQVREAHDPSGEVCLYTGGFPSRAVVAAARRLAAACDAPILHWGDLDPWGVRIALFLERELAPRAVRPHLMDPRTAERLGAPTSSALLHAPEGSSFAALAAYFSGPDPKSLEQEELDPVSPPDAAPPRSEPVKLAAP